jgi:hypothetical protein
VDIRSGFDPGPSLDFKCEHRNQNNRVARVIEDLVDIVCAIDGSRNKTCRFDKGPFRRNDSRFFGRHARMDSLPRAPERGVRAPLQE